MKTFPLVVLILAAVSSLTAQTAVWLAPGPHNPPADWNDPANWDTGVVPNAPEAVAVFPAYSLGLLPLGPDGTGTSTVPGTGPARIESGAITLGGLEWHLSGSATQTGASITIGTDSTSASLRFEGAGLRWVQTTPAGFWLPTVTVANGTLEFAGSSRAGSEGFGNGGLPIVVNKGATLAFHDNASADDAVISSRGVVRFDGEANAGQSSIRLYSNGESGSSFLDFWDQSGAGAARITLGDFATVSFHDDARAENAVFLDEDILPTGGPRHLTFADRSTADNASVEWTRPAGRVQFQDQSSAGTAELSLRDTSMVLTFRDDASAGQATVTGVGNVVFTHSATAADATISGYHILFRDTSTAGSASLSPAFDLATSSIEFHDQSSAGSATLSLGKLGRVVFAGDSDAGTATVVVGSGASEGLVVIRDNARTGGLAVTVAPDRRGRLDLSGSNHDEVEIGRLDGVVDVDLGARTLAFRSSGGGAPATLAGVISGSGGLIWDRASVLTIANETNDYAGSTLLLQGELRLADGRVSGLEMSAGTRLTGRGTVTGGLRNVGTVSPGLSAGTLTIEGDYVQDGGASLDIELFSPVEYDRLVVGGAASLDGRLNLFFAPGAALAGNATFEFLTAAGGVTGQFSSVASNLTLGAALGSQLVYTANGVGIAITQKPFSGFGGTSSSTALGAHLDATLASATGSYRALIEHLNTLPAASEVAAALAALAPDRHVTLARDGVLAAVAQQADRDRRLAALRDRAERGFEAFFEAGHRSVRLDATEGSSAVRSRSGGGTAGVYWKNGDGLALGASLSREDVTLRHDDGDRASTESLAPAVTFQYAGDAFFLSASAATSRDDHETTRRIAYAGVDDRAEAAFSGSRTDLALTVGRVIRAGEWEFVPQAGLLHTRWKTDDFVETGSSAAFALRDWSAKTLYARVGVEISRPSPTFTPVFSVSWLRASGNDHSLSAGFAAGPGAAYEIAGRAGERSLLQAGLALEKALGRKAVASLSAAGSWGDDAQVRSSLSAGLKWVF